MTSFTNKPIVTQETLGEYLKKVRLASGFSVRDIEKAIRVRKYYLEALEKSEYEKIPGEIYIKNFLTCYSKFLYLRPKDVLLRYEGERHVTYKLRSRNLASPSPSLFHALLKPRTVRFALIFLIVIAVVSYLSKEVYGLTSSPELIIESPIENMVTHARQVEVIGATDKESEVVINNKKVALDTLGRFKEAVSLKEGLNLISISSLKKFSKSTKKNLHILVVDD